MKKFAVLLLFIIFSMYQTAYAEGDLWDNFGDQNVYGQKPVSDKEFNDVLDKLKQKRQKKEKKFKGESYQHSNETDFINKVPEDHPILLVPLRLKLTNNTVLPVGHYQVIGEKKDNNAHIKLYQAHYLIAEIPVTETNEDFNQKEVYFVQLVSIDEKRVKLIYGSLDFNGYKILEAEE